MGFKKVLAVGAAVGALWGSVVVSSQVVVGEELNYNEPAIVSYLQLTNGKASFPPKSQISYIKVVNSQLKLDQDQVSYLEGVNSQIDVTGGFIASALIKGGEANFTDTKISSISVDQQGKVVLKGGVVASIVLNRGVVELAGTKLTTEGYTTTSAEGRPGKILIYPGGKLIIDGNYHLQNGTLTITYPGGGVTEAQLVLLNNGDPSKLISKKGE